METNLGTRQYWLTRRLSQRKRTNSRKYARNARYTRTWTNHTAVRRVDKSCCQGNEFTLNAVRLLARLRKLLSSDFNCKCPSK